MKLKEKPDLVKDLLFTSNIRFTFFKNVLQFSVGALIYVLTFRIFNLPGFVLGISSFLITYSSIYLFNDLMDFKKDKVSKEKISYKPLASGKLSFEKAISLMFFLIILGFGISAPFNVFFKVFLVLSLFGNFLHSSVYTRFKDKSVKFIYLGKGLADFSKPAMGWFSQTGSILHFPIFIVAMMASFQTFGYYFVTKKRMILDGHKLYIKDYKRAVGILVIIISLAMMSLIYSTFKFGIISIVLLVFISTLIVVKASKVSDSFKINSMNRLLSKIILLSLLVTFLIYLLNIPVSIDNSLNKFTENIRISLNNKTFASVETVAAWLERNIDTSGLVNSVYNITVVKINDESQ